MSSFNDKYVLITGGAGGIGLLMGKRALSEGAEKLIVWDIDRHRLQQLPDHFANNSSRLQKYRVDVSDPDQIYEARKQLLSELPRIDILINNAGTVVGKRFAEQNPDEITRTISINLLGAMHTTRAFLPDMIQNDYGHIVNVASASGFLGNPQMSVYASSKWGMIGWSESLRLELKENKGVKITTIEPSFIKTGLFAGVTPPLLTPLLEPEDISRRIIEAVKKDKIHLRAPFMVKLLPLLKGALSTRMFDFVAGKLFGVYRSMDTFDGRENSEM